jgi:hypothetical protein
MTRDGAGRAPTRRAGELVVAGGDGEARSRRGSRLERVDLVGSLELEPVFTAEMRRSAVLRPSVGSTEATRK